MIVGIGSDLVRVERLEKAFGRFGERFARRIFTPAEQACCNERGDRFSCYAKRFAAKEALVKALGQGMREGIWFLDVEVENNSLGQPRLNITGEAGRRIEALGGVTTHVSLSDDSGFALAFVVLEKNHD
ncbi:MAG: holo-ACP synthase [Magnetococcales bacterium]|nr:holo-ACP synthase [Magnetococcales bacterium]